MLVQSSFLVWNESRGRLVWHSVSVKAKLQLGAELKLAFHIRSLGAHLPAYFFGILSYNCLARFDCAGFRRGRQNRISGLLEII